MKIAILGASGFVGSHLVRYFGDMGYDIDGYSRSPLLPSAQPYCQWVYLDITNPEAIPHLSETYYDAIIYSIADTNYHTTTHTIEYFTSLISSVQTQHLIYISSSSVYMGQYGSLAENIQPIESSLNNYAKNKHQEEQYLLQYSQIINISILRPRAIYGIGDRILLYNLLTSTIFHRIPYLSGNKNISTSLTSINTLIAGIEYIIKNPKSGSQIYNIADDQTYSLYAIRKQINNIFWNKDPLIIPGFRNARHYGLINQDTYLGYQDIFGGDKILDTSSIKNIGFSSTYNFFDELPNIYQRRKQHVGSVSNMKRHRHDLPWMI